MPKTGHARRVLAPVLASGNGGFATRGRSVRLRFMCGPLRMTTNTCPPYVASLSLSWAPAAKLALAVGYGFVEFLQLELFSRFFPKLSLGNLSYVSETVRLKGNEGFMSKI